MVVVVAVVGWGFRCVRVVGAFLGSKGQLPLRVGAL